MPATRSPALIASGLLAAACATPDALETPDGLDRSVIDARRIEQVEAGREAGYPNLSEMPARREPRGAARTLAQDEAALRAEAAALRALREAAKTPRDASELDARREKLLAEIARRRAYVASRPPLTVPE